MVLFSGIGAAAGPITVGSLLVLGNVWFLIYLGGIHLILGLIVMYYMFQREPVPDEQQVDHQLITSRITPIALEAVALEAEESLTNEDDEFEDQEAKSD